MFLFFFNFLIRYIFTILTDNYINSDKWTSMSQVELADKQKNTDGIDAADNPVSAKESKLKNPSKNKWKIGKKTEKNELKNESTQFHGQLKRIKKNFPCRLKRSHRQYSILDHTD